MTTKNRRRSDLTVNLRWHAGIAGASTPACLVSALDGVDRIGTLASLHCLGNLIVDLLHHTALLQDRGEGVPGTCLGGPDYVRDGRVENGASDFTGSAEDRRPRCRGVLQARHLEDKQGWRERPRSFGRRERWWLFDDIWDIKFVVKALNGNESLSLSKRMSAFRKLEIVFGVCLEFYAITCLLQRVRFDRETQRFVARPSTLHVTYCFSTLQIYTPYHRRVVEGERSWFPVRDVSFFVRVDDRRFYVGQVHRDFLWETLTNG